MAQSTIIGLDAEITNADPNWPVLAYDDQVSVGTMLLWDTMNAECWPTEAIGGPVVAGDAWKNLGENFADGTQGTGAPPAYSAAGALFAAGSSSVLWPAGLFDLAALSWPNFAFSLWGKNPGAAPAVNLNKRLAAFAASASNTLTFGVRAAYSSGATTLSLLTNFAGSNRATTALPLGAYFCVQISCVDAGGGTRRVRGRVNNTQTFDATLTPNLAAQPAARFAIGKGDSGDTQPDGTLLSRVIFENCTVSGRDPEAVLAAEWAAQRAARGL